MKLEDLQRFCSTDNTRPGIVRPFNAGGFTYATDGRVCVRVPMVEAGLGDDAQPRSPETIFLLPGGYEAAVLPDGWEDTEQAYDDCKTCNGTGKVSKCRECEGRGLKTCPTCDTEHRCRRCRGTGLVLDGGLEKDECPDCDGEGRFERITPVDVNGGFLRVDLRYLKLVMGLPGVKLECHRADSPLRFTFNGGEGVVMPLRK